MCDLVCAMTFRWPVPYLLIFYCLCLVRFPRKANMQVGGGFIFKDYLRELHCGTVAIVGIFLGIGSNLKIILMFAQV